MSQTELQSIPQVCTVERHGTPQTEGPALLIELPHGATRAVHFEELAGSLKSSLPIELEQFFFVNTDVGCYETARAIALDLAERQHGCEVVIVRCLLPRTLVDCNRVLDAEAAGSGAMTPAIPEYVHDADDRVRLSQLHARYQQLVGRAYTSICGAKGMAMQLHTYAPRSIRIDRIDGSIVDALREAYAPEAYERWERRPLVELISEDEEGAMLAPPRLVQAIEQRYREREIDVARNVTYRLHRDTTGYVHATAHPGRVICVELNRELLADPFSPFEEMRIGKQEAVRMAEPLALAYIDVLEQGA